MVIAPNAYKGTLTAPDAARAIRQGVNSVWPDAICQIVPLADGGDGFLDTLLAAPGSEQFSCQVTGPMKMPASARVGWVGGSAARLAAVELAEASGLVLIGSPSPETALGATTRGLGELILTALTRGATRVLVGLGGSASTDGGAGLAEALGFRLLDRTGQAIGPGGKGLLELDRIDSAAASPLLQGADLVAAYDVDSPLLGPLGAAAVFGPQKGADSTTVAALERGLSRWAEVVERDLMLPRLDTQPGMGAAGGTGFGLATVAGALLEPGVSLVANFVGLDRALDQAELVITGEGRFDRGSLAGKVTGEVLRRAATRHLPCLVVSGSADPEAVLAARALGGAVKSISSGEAAPPSLSGKLAFAQLRTASRQACLEL